MTIALSVSAPFHRRLADHGYTLTGRSTCRNLSLGSSLAVHFGDRLALSHDAKPQLTLRAAIEIGSGSARDDANAIHWTIEKSALRLAGSEWMRLALEIDLFIAGGLLSETLRARANLFRRDLCALVEDAGAMLAHLPAESDIVPGPGPILRLEARLIGDVFAGRSGLITAGRAPMTLRHREANRAACGWLAQTILPELAIILPFDAVPFARNLEDIANKRERPSCA